MVRLAVDTRRVAGHTFVEGHLHNDADVTVRVTLATPLSPVYPPRSHGRPVDGWRPEEGHTVIRLAAGQRVGVGFATPAVPDESAMTVVETERDPATDGGLTTPSAVVDALGDPLPPPEVAADPPTGSDASRTTADTTEAGDGAVFGGVTRADADTDADLQRLRRAAADLARAAADAERRLGGTQQ